MALRNMLMDYERELFKEFGYVEEFERRLSEDNHARVYFTITESGRQYLKDIIAEYRQMTAAIDAVLSSGGDEA